MYANKKVDRTLDEKYMTPFLKKAQIAEFRELKKAINEVYSETQKPLNILDLGVGNGRIPLLLSQEPIWGKIKLYVGIDNSKIELKKCRRDTKAAKIYDIVKPLYFDASDLAKRNSSEIFEHKYGLIICTYFTPGNFKPREIQVKIGENGLIVPYPQSCLEPNREFIRVFKAAHKLLDKKGRIVLGTTYIDSDTNRMRQEKFYRKCGMTVITSKKDSFTATKEGFWSQRFTKKRIREYFLWLKKKKISFVPLDNYHFARMIIIKK